MVGRKILFLYYPLYNNRRREAILPAADDTEDEWQHRNRVSTYAEPKDRYHCGVCAMAAGELQSDRSIDRQNRNQNSR